MNSRTIQIQIAGRTYPATVPADQEEFVRKASKQINEQIKTFGAQFPSTDVQDQLALSALDNLSRHLAMVDEWEKSKQQMDLLISDIEAI